MTAEIFTWYDADDNPFILNNGTTYDVRWGVEGRLWPEYDFITDEQYQKAGDRVNLIKVKPRTITLPLTVYGTSAADKLTNLRALEYAFDPMRGMGRLEITTCDSLVKNLDCYCSVWDAGESTDTSGGTFFIFVVTLHAPYPYWYSGTSATQTWTVAGWGPTNVTNAGSTDAYPTWVITPNGTITTITLTNNTTGKVISLTGMPASTAVVTITTKPGSESIIRTTGANYASYMSSTSSMWPLKPGINSITVAASSAPTSIVATYYPQYHGV